MTQDTRADALDKQIQQINRRLRNNNVRASLYRRNKKLYLQATLPPKPGSSKDRPYQQYVALGISANPAGLKVAEARAKELDAALGLQRFNWDDFLTAKPNQRRKNELTAQEWIERFEADYFSNRPRSLAKLSTFKEDFYKQFRRLPLDEPLSIDRMLSVVAQTEPDTRSRKMVCYALAHLARFAELDERPIARLKGNYTPQRVKPKDLPPDELILEWFHKIKNPAWKSVYAMYAVYGIRTHEVFHLDLSRVHEPPGILQVKDETKTGYRLVWPCYSYWWELFEVWKLQLPNIDVSGKSNKDLSSKVGFRFREYGIPFTPYTLRHAWAARTAVLNLDSTVSAKMMGHAHDVHTDIYHHWMNETHFQKAFDLMRLRED